MRGLSVFAATAGLLIAGSDAIRLLQRDAAPAVLGLAIERKDVSDSVARDRLRRRQNTKTVTEPLDNEVGSFEAVSGSGY